MGILTIYYKNKDEACLKELHSYADKKNWSVSVAVMQILKQVLSNVQPEPIIETKPISKEVKNIIKSKPIKKIDLATFEAEMMSKAMPASSDVDNCEQRHIVEGKPDCYMFNNFRVYYPYCVKDCWGSTKIWGNHARKLKPTGSKL